jgi:hypothetical protein
MGKNHALWVQCSCISSFAFRLAGSTHFHFHLHHCPVCLLVNSWRRICPDPVYPRAQQRVEYHWLKILYLQHEFLRSFQGMLGWRKQEWRRGENRRLKGSSVSQISVTVTKYLRKSTWRRKDLFWLTISVSVWLAPVLWTWGKTEYHGSRST